MHNHTTPSSIYSMHKYWGKKPSKDLKEILETFSNKNDTILDPFSGYGGVAIESILMNRNVIANDLNPVANFISKCILSVNVDFKVLDILLEQLYSDYAAISQKYYTYKGEKILTILRNDKDIPLMLKLVNKTNHKTYEITLTDKEVAEFLQQDKEIIFSYWYPRAKLIRNSRISAKDNMEISDLFPARALYCQSYLKHLIESLPNSIEKDLILFSFNSNLANCSKLVPPIKSRGAMAQGAWMTGFYIGNTYLENNVFHYFENRMRKTIKGKKDYINLYQANKTNGHYRITNDDAKHLHLETNSIDFVFTDFPYGDTVPYFEQSQIWNAWLKFDVDYENEIVISDSKLRNKTQKNFEKDISRAIQEINRVLKNQSYFVFTFHSLDGNEWKAISNALVANNFEFIQCTPLFQKTLSPRQLDRKNSIKGDLIVVYKKTKTTSKRDKTTDVTKLILSKTSKFDPFKDYDTNEVITICISSVLESNSIKNEINFLELANTIFTNNGSTWRIKNELY